MGGRRWSESEDARIRRAAETASETLQDVARALGRSYAATRQRAIRIGAYSYRVRPPAPLPDEPLAAPARRPPWWRRLWARIRAWVRGTSVAP